MRWPNGSLDRPYVTSGFGPREASGGASSYHRGTDFIGFSTLRAVAPGTVRCSGSAPDGWANGGDQVWIQHDGFFTRSLHQAYSLVSDGQWVNEGDPIGVMGESGSAQGVHQHFELIPGSLHFGNYGQVDPVAFISARLGGGNAPAPANRPPAIQSEEDTDMPINFRNPNTGITYTMVPGYSIRGHVNSFGNKLTNYVNTGRWAASEEPGDLFNAGVRDLNRDHVAWMLGFYGFERLTPETLPQPGQIVYSDKIQDQDTKLQNISNSIKAAA